MSRLLKSEGYKTPRTARSRKSAMRMLKLKPSLIILDLKLPDADELKFISEIRAKNGSVPIIVLSGAGELESSLQALKAGAFWYIHTPLVKTEFFEAIKRALELQTLTQQNSLLRDSIDRLVHSNPKQTSPLMIRESTIPKRTNISEQVERQMTINDTDLSSVESAPSQLFAGLSLAEIEQRAVIETLTACSGNKALAARKLGISEKTIYNMMKRFNIRISSKHSHRENENEEGST